MDIVERLKKMAGKGDYYDDEYRAAIAEIERLREEVAQITKDRNRHAGMVIDLLDKYFDSVTIRTSGGKSNG